MFFVGQKVTCTNDRNWPTPRDFGAYSPTLPVRGRVYTVREVVPMMRRGFDEDGLFLEEIVNPIQTRRDGSTFELVFRQSRFRPLRATSIDLFLEMLQPEPVSERLRAERLQLEVGEALQQRADRFVAPVMPETSLPPFKIVFTRRARTAAKASASLAAVEEMARSDLTEFGIEDLLKLGFHSFDLNGQSYFCSPRDAKTLVINLSRMAR
jgi:hypothetical protein